MTRMDDNAVETAVYMPLSLTAVELILAISFLLIVGMFVGWLVREYACLLSHIDDEWLAELEDECSLR